MPKESASASKKASSGVSKKKAPKAPKGKPAIVPFLLPWIPSIFLVKREPSAYNKFLKTELAKLKLANPTVAQKDIMRMAAANWKTSPSNPAASKSK